MTFILPTDKSSTKILQGIIMLSKLKKFVLTDNMTYQQYMVGDFGIENTMILLYDCFEYQWMIILFLSKNVAAVNNVCQHININIYNLFYES